MCARSVEVTHKVKYEFDLDFWNGFHLEISGLKVVLARIFLVNPSSEKRLSFPKYLSAKHLSLLAAMPIVKESLGEMEFFSRRTSAISHKLAMLSANRISILQEHLSDNSEKLRGMEERAIIVCGDGTSLIRASKCLGGVPSVESQRVEYPDATYRERDTYTEMVDQGQPRIVSVWSKEEKPYPTQFRIAKRTKRQDYPHLWFAIEYKTKTETAKRQPSVEGSYFHFGGL